MLDTHQNRLAKKQEPIDERLIWSTLIFPKKKKKTKKTRNSLRRTFITYVVLFLLVCIMGNIEVHVNLDEVLK